MLVMTGHNGLVCTENIFWQMLLYKATYFSFTRVSFLAFEP